MPGTIPKTQFWFKFENLENIGSQMGHTNKRILKQIMKLQIVLFGRCWPISKN
jgi:hypothetical protein